VDHTGTTPTAPSPQAQDENPPATTSDATAAPADGAAAASSEPAGGVSAEPPGFASRGRARRRARFLRKARELAYRDLGGLVFNLHRYGQRGDELVLAKLTTLGQIDGELRAIERALGERRPITVLREAGITACPRCAAIHGSQDSFCPNCGMSMGRHADLPIAGAPAPPTASAPPASTPTPQVPSPAPMPQPTPPASSVPAIDDGATEIIRPPASGS
jgi:septal ring-binding cell division protein DamX